MPENYYQRNLKGSSFKGKDLSQANFIGADIRGASFTNALLTGARFNHAKAGLKPSWVIGLGISIFFLAVLTGLILGYAGAFPAFIFRILSKESTFPKAVLVVTGLFILTIFFWVILQRGIGAALGILAITTAISTGIIFFGSDSNDIVAAALLQAITIAITIAGILTGSLVISLSWQLARKELLIPIGASAILSTTLGAWESLVGIGKLPPLPSLLMSNLLAVTLLALSGYVGFKAIAGDRRFELIRSISISLLASFGTSFRGANLTDADFSQCTLPFCDFRKAILKRTSWHKSSNLELSRVEGTYLEDPDLRDLLTTKDGQRGVYDSKNLQGLNLQEANLTEASFIGADLSESNLQEANFTRAKLVKTRLYATNLTQSCLTGACIQDWAISTDTQLEQVRCTHIYMRLPTQEDPDPWRKPDNRNETFKEGDFTDFIAPIVKTLDLYRQQNVDPRRMARTFKSLDLYHYDGIDPAAAAVAIKQLAEENPEAGLEVVALEGRGEEKVRLQAVVTGEIDNSQLNAMYFEKYHQISSLPYKDIQALLAGAAEKDERIHNLEKLLENALQQPKFYIETYQNQGEFIMSQSKGNINIGDVQGAVVGLSATGENSTITESTVGLDSGNISTGTTQNKGSATENVGDVATPSAPTTKTILIMTANPTGTSELRLDIEMREIQAGLERAQRNEHFVIQQRWAVRPRDVRRALLDYKPQIIHFSGHGGGEEGLVLENETEEIQFVSTEALSSLFGLFANQVECVILNACYSKVQAKAIAQHISYVIGMKKEIGDQAAIEFAVGFYDALGAGESYEFAYRMGCSAIQMMGISEHLTPIIERRLS